MKNTKLSSGFICEACGGNSLHVYDTRMVAKKINVVRRHRVCDSCGHKMTFYEMSSLEYKRYKALGDFATALFKMMEKNKGFVKLRKEIEG